MSKIISIHSFRGGTGKSNTTANLAVLLAAQGKRVGVIDTDIQSPGIHVLFGLEDPEIGHSINDYLWDECDIRETAHDVSGNLGAEVSGKVFLIPSSLNGAEIARVLRDGYEVSLLNEGIQDLINELNLDFLMIDTHPGINEETLVSISISDVLLLILRPDQQDYQGTAVAVDIARQLYISNLMLLVNKVPDVFNRKDVKTKIERTYSAEVVGLLPHSDEMMALASEGIFVTRFPDHPITTTLKDVAEILAEA
jgi:MinD-like ATPase involved in chromosome partitioning or flagellar assembly